MMKKLAWSAALTLASIAATPATAAATVIEEDSGGAATTARSRRIYDEAGAPGMENDHLGRLAIYRRALVALDADSPPARRAPEVQAYRLFLQSTIAIHRLNTPEQTEALAEVDRLLPLVRTARQSAPANSDLATALGQLLRTQVRTAILDGNPAAAAAPAREAVALLEVLTTNAPNDPFLRRSLAIDLDQLAAIELGAGDRAAANQASRRALGIFRELAAAEPDSRPAQGSLLIALTRRIMNFDDHALLDEAERQVAMMQRRGMFTANYAPIRDALAEARRRSPR